MRIVRANTEDYEDYFNITDIEDALRIMGFTYLEMNFFRREDPDQSIVMYAELFDDAVILDMYVDSEKVDTTTLTDPEELITWVETHLAEYGIENVKIVTPEEIELVDDGVFPSSAILSSKTTRIISRKKTSTKDMADKLLRVKSSNVWAYAFNPKTEEVGDMLMQFKGKNGGPGDIYIYYDVPTKIWRRLVAAPSVGHAFWALIRHNYTYAKLTGDKRTKLPNGI